MTFIGFLASKFRDKTWQEILVTLCIRVAFAGVFLAYIAGMIMIFYYARNFLLAVFSASIVTAFMAFAIAGITNDFRD